MAYDETLAQRIRDLLQKREVSEFGFPVLQQKREVSEFGFPVLQS